MKKILIIQNINEAGPKLLADHPDYEFEIIEVHLQLNLKRTSRSNGHTDERIPTLSALPDSTVVIKSYILRTLTPPSTA